MKKQQIAVIDSNCIITHTTRALLSKSSTQLTAFQSGSVIVPELTTNLVTSSLSIDKEDVNLTITSDYFKPMTFKVGSARSSDIIISEHLAMIAGLQIYRLCKALAKRGETEPMSLFNIQLNYSGVCEDVQQPRERIDEVQQNTLF